MTDAPTPLSLTELPARIRKKIRLNLENEREACWEWIGSFRAPARYHKEYPVKEDTSRFRHTTGCMVNARGTPTVWVGALGYPVAAYRVVYGLVHGIDLKAVPKLGRCANDRCVNPHHTHDMGSVPDTRPHLGAMRVLEQFMPGEPHPRPQLVGDANAETPLATLQRVRPFSELSIESAEDECELPRGSITPETWAQYLAWDEANLD